MTETLAKPKPREITLPKQDALLEYNRLAKELEYRPEDMATPILLAILQHRKVPIYDSGEVLAYLKRIARGKEVVWRALKLGYTKTVPIHILCRAACLKKTEPDLWFEVSEIDAEPDPFLSVRHGRSARIIIGAWDEPTFEGRPEA